MAPPFVPTDGRLTSLQSLTGTLTGGEVMEIVSPGNVAAGNNYQIQLSTLAAYFALGGSNPVVTSITSGAFIYNGAPNQQSGNYTLQASDNGQIVTMANSASATITVPVGLNFLFACTVIQIGLGTVQFAAGVGATVNSFGNRLKLGGQFAGAAINGYDVNTYVLIGNIAP